MIDYDATLQRFFDEIKPLFFEFILFFGDILS